MTKTIALVVMVLMLGGCVSTVASVVTAPVRVVAKGADWATTSRDEADRNRGRQIRKAEERARKACRREVEGDDAREHCIRERMRNDAY